MNVLDKSIHCAVVVLFFSCGEVYKKVPIEQLQSTENTLAIISTKELSFELDSLTAPLLNNIQEYHNGIEHSLIYLNEETGGLYVNDLRTGEIVKKIEIKDGQSKHNKLFQGFYYRSKDSIFMISFKPKVILIDGSGNVIREYILRDRGNSEMLDKLFLKGLWASTTVQPYLYKGILHLASVVSGNNKDKKIQIRLNTVSGEVSAGEVSFPDIYNQHDFGSINYEIYSVCANTKDHSLIYSFPQYENVIVYSIPTKDISVKSAQSKYIHEFIEYDKANYKNSKSSPTLEYFMTTPSYGGIYYDEYRNIYYRIALLPVDERNYNYDEKYRPLKQISVVVFDRDFKYMGEALLDKNKYLMFDAFVSYEGLNIQKKTNTDETLDFTTIIFK